MITRGDLALSLGLAALGVVGLVSEPVVDGTPITREWDTLGVVLALGMTLPVVLRRRYPVLVVAATAGAALAATGIGYGTGFAQLGFLMAMASAAYFTSRAVTIRLGAAIAGLVVLTLVLALPGDAGVSPGILAGSVASVVLALVSGDLLREARHAEREVALSAERARIAREVHDVVGHALAGIALQARAGVRRLDRDPARAAAALEQIDALASSALSETRQAVGLIRGDEERAALAPQPTLEHLDALVESVRAPEIRVELDRRGIDADVPPSVQRTAYRIVQEALSNVVRHARPATAVVRIERLEHELSVTIVDDGARGPSAASNGHGLIGMRERIEQCGGTLDVGPRSGGGWAVIAQLPLSGAP